MLFRSRCVTALQAVLEGDPQVRPAAVGQLRPVAATSDETDILLTLPRVAAANGHVEKDATITALQRPYGIEFASGQPHAAFFLALANDWVRDLKTAPLTL